MQERGTPAEQQFYKTALRNQGGFSYVKICECGKMQTEPQNAALSHPFGHILNRKPLFGECVNVVNHVHKRRVVIVPEHEFVMFCIGNVGGDCDCIALNRTLCAKVKSD